MSKPTLQQELLRIYSDKYPDDGLPDKQDFHRMAKRLCRQIAVDLGLAKGTYTIRTNMAGDGVGGETTLQTESLYLQLSADSVAGLEILYRESKGPGMNHWTTYERVAKDYKGFLESLLRV